MKDGVDVQQVKKNMVGNNMLFLHCVFWEVNIVPILALSHLTDQRFGHRWIAVQIAVQEAYDMALFPPFVRGGGHATP
mgnify:CR=1 FL=1